MGSSHIRHNLLLDFGWFIMVHIHDRWGAHRTCTFTTTNALSLAYKAAGCLRLPLPSMRLKAAARSHTRSRNHNLNRTHSFVNSVTDKLTGAVSLSAAVFSSVLIASCMPSELDVVSVTFPCSALCLLCLLCLAASCLCCSLLCPRRQLHALGT